MGRAGKKSGSGRVGSGWQESGRVGLGLTKVGSGRTRAHFYLFKHYIYERFLVSLDAVGPALGLGSALLAAAIVKMLPRPLLFLELG